MNAIEEIKSLIKEEGKLIIGTEETMKALKAGNLTKVFISSNCASDVKEDLEKYCKMSEVELVGLETANDELGIICKKPFRISVIGLRK